MKLINLNADLEQLNVDSASGDHSIIAKRDTLALEWIDVFRRTANYVNVMAKGDVPFILKTGFDTNKFNTEHIEDATELIGFTSKILQSKGGMEIECDRQVQANAFLFMASTTNVQIRKINDVIIINAGDETIYLMPNMHHYAKADCLTSGEKLSTCGVAFNINGVGPITKTGNEVTIQ